MCHTQCVPPLQMHMPFGESFLQYHQTLMVALAECARRTSRQLHAHPRDWVLCLNPLFIPV